MVGCYQKGIRGDNMDYKEKIAQMTTDELKEETKEKIWSSAFWRWQYHESHEQLDACCDEWLKRDGNYSTYKLLHKEVMKEYTGK